MKTLFFLISFFLFVFSCNQAWSINAAGEKKNFAHFSVQLPDGWSGDETTGFISDDPAEYMLAFTKKNKDEDGIEAQVTIYLLPNKPKKNAEESALILAESQGNSSKPVFDGYLWTFTGEPRSNAIKAAGQTWVNASSDNLLIVIMQDPLQTGGKEIVKSLSGATERAIELLGR